MFGENIRKDIFTIPNLLSILRIILIPVYVTIYLSADSVQDYFTAGAIIAVSCMTDAVDGQIARRCQMVTTLGKILDPLADKLTQLSLIICLSLRHPVLYPVLILLAGKELFQLIAAILFYRNGKMLSGALSAGKICTCVLFISLITLVLFPGMSQLAVNITAAVDAVFITAALISYILAYFGKNTPLENTQ